MKTNEQPGYFSQTVDKRSRKELTDFLQNHSRYDTMSSWNNSTSYAHNIKINRLGLTREQTNAAYEMLDTDFWDEGGLNCVIEDFTAEQNGYYTIGNNGRSGGYLVLYNSRREPTGHLSYCPKCGQRNSKKVAPVFDDPNRQVIATEILNSANSWTAKTYLEQSAVKALTLSEDEKLAIVNTLKSQLRDTTKDSKCGRCGHSPRVDYKTPPMTLNTYPGKSIDQGEDFDPEEWTMDQLRERVELVQAFDRACDDIRAGFIYMLDNYDIEEETVYTPEIIHVLKEKAA